jgi:hypothetical protein
VEAAEEGRLASTNVPHDTREKALMLTPLLRPWRTVLFFLIRQGSDIEIEIDQEIVAPGDVVLLQDFGEIRKSLTDVGS